MSRELDDWFDAYMEYTASSESPMSYHAWCAMGVIAGALQRKVYIKQGLEREIFPNLYILLIGPSGRTRKGVALGIAKDFLSSVKDVTIAPESTSGREALVRVMIHAKKDYTDPSAGVVKQHCAISVFSEELSVFLGQADIKLLANMTDWWEGKSPWSYETIRRGIDTVHGICFNLLGASAPDWFSSMLPPEAIGGGFTARCIFVVEEWKKHANPSHDLTPREIELRNKLEHDLIQINKLAGRFTFTEEAQQAYNDWYMGEHEKMRSGYMPVPDYRFASYCERRQTHLRKIMMCLSASRGDSLVLSIEHFQRGLDLLRQAERKMAKTFGSFSSFNRLPGDHTEKILEYIKGIGITTQKLVLQRFAREVDKSALETIELDLWKRGLIRVSPLPEMEDRKYEYVQQTQH